MIQEVKRCLDCPFIQWEDLDVVCKHPTLKDDNIIEENPYKIVFPAKCPLVWEGITVKISE